MRRTEQGKDAQERLARNLRRSGGRRTQTTARSPAVRSLARPLTGPGLRGAHAGQACGTGSSTVAAGGAVPALSPITLRKPRNGIATHFGRLLSS